MQRRVLNTAVFSLLRVPNLLIVALVQAIVYFKVLLPAFSAHGIQPKLDALRFGLFIVTTLCITAGGYIVNDIIDVPADRINKPDRVIVGRRLMEQTAYWLYFCLNLTGFTLALYLGFYVRQIALAGLDPLAGAGLFLYSLRIKQIPLAGNLLVGAYCAAVAGIVWFAEREAFYQLGIADVALQRNIAVFFTGYMALAFLATLFREIVKDLEDMPGDKASGARTFPVWAGEKEGRIAAFAAGLATAAVFLILLFRIYPIFYTWSLPVITAAVLLPLGIGMTRILRARTREDYRRLSLLAKWIIVAGLLMPAFIQL